MDKLRLVSTAACLGFMALEASAEVPSGPDARWAVIASSEGLDDAIGIASLYRWRFDDVRVVRSSNGWLAVIAGPVPVPNGVAAAKRALMDEGGLPADMFMSNGADFEITLWRPETVTSPTWQADSSGAVRFESSGLSLTVDTALSEGDMYSPRITGTMGGRPAFSSVMSDVSTEDGQSSVTAVPLDPVTPIPEIVFSAYWRGAHCCTVTEIFSQVNDHWIRTEASTLDGGGYTFQDLDGDGSMELVRTDNSFLYAYAPYAYSWAPPVVEHLRAGVLLDRSHDKRFETHFRRTLSGMEHVAGSDASLWHSNGFLAAWVATKARVGEFDDAWARMLASFDRSGNWPLRVCSQPMRSAECPDSSKVSASFPVALKAHLQEQGYIPGALADDVVAAAPSPNEVVQAPAMTERPDDRPAPVSSGTGFFVSASGEVLTNFHVIDRCHSPVVLHGRSPALPASIVARDETNDLALLQVDKAVDGFATFNVRVRLGEPVAAFGYPLSSILSSGGNFTLGSVTALSGLRDDSRYLQTSAPVQPGNSGGPLVDYRGNVAGVVTAKFNAFAAMVATGDIVQNVNFAIRSSTAVSFLLANDVDVAIADSGINQDQLEPPNLAGLATGMSVAIQCG